jgi:Protein of unknown function (DUF1186)/SEC-C motif
MHVISNECALSHWQALNRLPASAAKCLKTRFLREQPVLAGAFLPPKDDPATAPENLYDFDDPAMAGFWRLAEAGAILNEIFVREAGRPLRQVTAEELDAITGEIEAQAGGLDAAKAGNKQQLGKLLADCSQAPLMRGAAAAYLGDAQTRREVRALEILLLRIMIEGLNRACGDEPAVAPRGWDQERIRFALSTQGDPLRREALAACDAFHAELVPDLLAELAGWADEPHDALLEDGSLGMHALFLLGKWREEAAWPVFRKLVSLPGTLSYDLLGDLITEDASILLAMVVGGRRDELRAMIEDEQLDEYCRNACLDALTSLVAWDELPRAEHVAYLRGLLTGGLRGVPENEHVFGGVVSAVCDLEAWELQPEVEAAYERGAVDETFIDLEFFLDAKAGEYREQWQAFRETHQLITDVAAATKWLDRPPELPEPLDPEEGNLIAQGQPYMPAPKVGRNEPCPCGSGKKYKKCCGA